MPELPDVEGFRRLLERHGAGRRVCAVDVRDAGVLHGLSSRRFAESVSGRCFASPRRHGKWLLAPLDSPGRGGEAGPTIIWHFGMTGSLEWAPKKTTEHHPHDRIVLDLDRGQLAYRDQRKLQGVWFAADSDEADRIIGPQGPDALGISKAELAEHVGSRRGGLKAALMDQHVIAGVGNLLADEVLWRARLYPGRRAGKLSNDELQRLHRCLQQVLRTSIPHGRIPTAEGWLTGVRDQPDARCPRSGHPLSDGRVDGRRTRWCPGCQPQQ
ncbi:MAG: hypothetical protein J2P57_06745 [Acidimicrobiaceae bacterium]|nr:hypothetical protein [Acidimicrobiaceae bacterium]